MKKFICVALLLLLATSALSEVKESEEMPCRFDGCDPCKKYRIRGDTATPDQNEIKCTDCGAFFSLGYRKIPQSNDVKDRPKLCSAIATWLLIVIIILGVVIIALIIFFVVRAMRRKNAGGPVTAPVVVAR